MTALPGLHRVAMMAAEPPTLSWRSLAVSDAVAMADLLNAVDELDSPVVDLPTSTLAVFDGPTMLGFSAVHDQPPAEVVHRVQAAGAVRPTHRRRGLGTTLLRHGLETARTLHARHHPTLHLVVESVYGEHVDGAVALYRAAGMTATQWNRHLRHPLGAAPQVAPIPDGMRIEGYTAETDEEFRALRDDAFQADGSARLGAEEWKAWVRSASFRPELSFLLRDVETGTAAGIVLTVCWEADIAASAISASSPDTTASLPSISIPRCGPPLRLLRWSPRLPGSLRRWVSRSSSGHWSVVPSSPRGSPRCWARRSRGRNAERTVGA